MDDKLFEQWKAKREAEVEHLNAEIFKAESYLHCLRQLKDAAILCSYPGGFKVEKVLGEQKVPFVRLTEDEVQVLIGRDLSKYELICAVENRLAEKNK